MLADEDAVVAAMVVLALAEGLSVDPDLFFQAVRGGPLDLPVAEAIAQHFASAAKDHADKDVSATYLAIAGEAPLGI